MRKILVAIFLSITLCVFSAQQYIGSLPTSSSVVPCNGSIGTGGTPQPLFTGAQYKHGFIVEVGANDSNTDALYFSDVNTTSTPAAGDNKSWSVAPSTAAAPGGSFSSPPNYPVGVDYFINGASTGDKYKCRVW